MNRTNGFEIDPRLHKALFEVMNTHSMLDHNLGLCLSHLRTPGSPTESHKYLSTRSCAQKIDALLELLRESFPQAAQSFEAWAEQASSMRAIRNTFAHGSWEILPMRDRPIGVRIPKWVSNTEEISNEFTIEEMEDIASQMQAHFRSFMSWRRSNKL